MTKFFSLSQLLIIPIFILAFFLRLYQIDTNPPGLYIDEVSIGQNAYDILTTSKDEHGKPFPLFFEAFGEYKMPVYIYTTAVFEKVLGKNELAVRLPSAIAGSISVVIFYLLLVELFQRDFGFEIKHKNSFLFITTMLLAISPWQIQFSRAGFEVTFGVCFYLLGLLFFLYYLQKQKLSFFIIICVTNLLAFYSYNIFRVIIPLTLVFYLFIGYKEKYKLTQQKLITLIVFLLGTIPMLLFSVTAAGTARLNQTSAFSDYAGTLVENLYTYPLVFVKNYISYFSPSFLFSFGDGIGRHMIPGMGPLFIFQSVFIVIGMYLLWKKGFSKATMILIFLLLIAPTAASFARPSPHLLRSLLLVYPLTILTGLGMQWLVNKMYAKLWPVLLLTAIVFFEFFLYIHFYYVHYPKTNILDWGGGEKTLAVELDKLSQKYPHIYADKSFQIDTNYFQFYGNTLPIIVDDTWKKPTDITTPVLFITKNNNTKTTENEVFNVLETITLPNDNKDVFAYIIEL